MKRSCMLTLAVVPLLAAAPALAADYPDKPVLFVVPFAAGSAPTWWRACWGGRWR